MNDGIVDLTNDDTAPIVFEIEVPGKPVALPRHRHNRNGWFNAKKPEVAAFKARLKAELPTARPIYPTGVPVTVTVRFYMRRPNDHFKADDRAKGLKRLIPRVRPIKPDIDNLAKFVLDGMNNLVYKDDCQVVKLIAYKLQDSDDQCEGRTVVKVQRYDEED